MPNNTFSYILVAVIVLLGAAMIYNTMSINALTDMFTDQIDINRKILDMFGEILK